MGNYNPLGSSDCHGDIRCAGRAYSPVRNLVSDIGKILDPFSDVLSRVTYFICFTAAGLMPLWAMIVIVWREFCIMFIRMVMAKEGTALAARNGGKAKAVFYFSRGYLPCLF